MQQHIRVRMPLGPDHRNIIERWGSQGFHGGSHIPGRHARGIVVPGHRRRGGAGVQPAAHQFGPRLPARRPGARPLCAGSPGPRPAGLRGAVDRRSEPDRRRRRTRRRLPAVHGRPRTLLRAAGPPAAAGLRARALQVGLSAPRLRAAPMLPGSSPRRAVIGCALALSSTAIVVPVLAERKRLGTDGRAARPSRSCCSRTSWSRRCCSWSALWRPRRRTGVGARTAVHVAPAVVGRRHRRGRPAGAAAAVPSVAQARSTEFSWRPACSSSWARR